MTCWQSHKFIAVLTSSSNKNWCPLSFSFRFKKRLKSDKGKTGLYGGWSKTNQGGETLQSLVYLCEASQYHGGVKPAICQDKFFEYVPSVFAAIKGSTQELMVACCSCLTNILHCTILTDVLQKPLVAEIWNFTQKCRKANRVCFCLQHYVGLFLRKNRGITFQHTLIYVCHVCVY